MIEETVTMIWTYVCEDEIDDQDAGRRPYEITVPAPKQSANGDLLGAIQAIANSST